LQESYLFAGIQPSSGAGAGRGSRENDVNEPGFVTLATNGELEARADAAAPHLLSCGLCPRECGVDGASGERGWCGAGPEPRVYRHMSHPGEEPPVSGAYGSGVVFFSHCTMACAYCQNHRWSQLHEGRDRTVAELGGMFVSLAEAGCHNLNLVSATQFLPAVLEALRIASGEGVRLPVVWNTSGYESPAALELLDGVVDVYLADLRYADDRAARELSDAPDYVATARDALTEMNRQVGVLELNPDGTAASGLIVRHLVLPNDLSSTEDSLQWVASELGRDTFVSLMAQYYPTKGVEGHPEAGRRITRAEWDRARDALAAAGIDNGWVQELPDSLSGIAGTEIGPDPDADRDA
jgi:putative pyruvate formate lyase activating enzyme